MQRLSWTLKAGFYENIEDPGKKSVDDLWGLLIKIPQLNKEPHKDLLQIFKDLQRSLKVV